MKFVYDVTLTNRWSGYPCDEETTHIATLEEGPDSIAAAENIVASLGYELDIPLQRDNGHDSLIGSMVYVVPQKHRNIDCAWIAITPVIV